ncbi:MAG: hypothetical protein VXW28_04095 [Candidatus Thermoplasmatota archaeon]|nr:hypothetical protein [Candidatus Thermoplasmatota archaeon]
MADIFYGVAGHPISHSLSPVLINIVAQYVSNQTKSGPKFNVRQTDLVSAEQIQDALAWGYVKSTPEPINWDLTGAPFGKFRNKALMQKVLEATAEVTQSIDGLVEEKPGHVPTDLPFNLKIELPTKSFTEEVWLNLTSPLKHQLKSQAVVDFNDSSLIESVNALRWDGFGWWSTNVDGSGVARVAQYFGIDIANGAVIGIVGGGGAARSTARTWQKLGGKVLNLGGKRDLDNYDWFESQITGEKQCDVLINFDDDTTPNEVNVAGFVMNANYEIVDAEHLDRVSAITDQVVDGRWLLSAQHLECWRQLWAPHAENLLPSLDLLVTMLVTAESVLASYS